MEVDVGEKYMRPAFHRGKLARSATAVALPSPATTAYRTSRVGREDGADPQPVGMFIASINAEADLYFSWLPEACLRDDADTTLGVQFFHMPAFDINHIRIAELERHFERVVFLDRYGSHLPAFVFPNSGFSRILSELKSNDDFQVFADPVLDDADSHAIALLPPPRPLSNTRKSHRSRARRTSSFSRSVRQAFSSLHKLVVGDDAGTSTRGMTTQQQQRRRSSHGSRRSCGERPFSNATQAKTQRGSHTATMASGGDGRGSSGEGGSVGSGRPLTPTWSTDEVSFLRSLLSTAPIPTMDHAHEEAFRLQANQSAHDVSVWDHDGMDVEHGNERGVESVVEEDNDGEETQGKDVADSSSSGLLSLAAEQGLQGDDLALITKLAALGHQEFCMHVYRHALPHSCRRILWPYLLGVFTWKCTAGELRQRRATLQREYTTLLRLVDNQDQARDHDLAKYERIITCDIERTDINYSSLFHGVKETFMQHERQILRAYLYHNRTVYSQAMCDIIEPLLAVAQEPSIAYKCFANVMSFTRARFDECDENNAQRQLLSLQRLLFLFDRPLHDALNLESSDDLFVCYRWLLVDFKRELRPENTLALWERLWAGRWVVSSSISLFLAYLILRKYRDELIGKTCAQLLAFFNRRAFDDDIRFLMGEVDAFMAESKQRLQRQPSPLTALLLQQQPQQQRKKQEQQEQAEEASPGLASGKLVSSEDEHSKA